MTWLALRSWLSALLRVRSNLLPHVKEFTASCTTNQYSSTLYWFVVVSRELMIYLESCREIYQLMYIPTLAN